MGELHHAQVNSAVTIVHWPGRVISMPITSYTQVLSQLFDYNR